MPAAAREPSATPAEDNPVGRLASLAGRYLRATDPAKQAALATDLLQTIDAAKPVLRASRQELVMGLREADWTWKEIAEALGGISIARAHQIGHGVIGGQHSVDEPTDGVPAEQ